MMKLRKLLIFSAIGLALIVIAAACFRQRGNDDTFTQIDQAVSELDLQSLGQVALDERYGRRGISGDPPTRRLAILPDESAEQAERALSDRLTAAGFTQSTSTSWRRGSGENFILVGIVMLDPGEALPAGSDPGTVPQDTVGIVVEVSTQV